MKTAIKLSLSAALMSAAVMAATPATADTTKIIVIDYYKNCAERIDRFVDKINAAKRPSFRPYTLSQATDACREGRVKHSNMILTELEDEWEFRSKIYGKKRPE